VVKTDHKGASAYLFRRLEGAKPANRYIQVPVSLLKSMAIDARIQKEGKQL